MTPLGTSLFTLFCGKHVGNDAFGNKYYQEKRTPKRGRRKRWVIFKGKAEASKIPAVWHGWMHYTQENPPSREEETVRYAWEKEHIPNLTGTELKYVPPGHMLRGGKRDASTSDYQAWKPE